MPQIVQKMYGSSTSSADAVMSVDIQEDGVIEGMLFEHQGAGDAVNEGARWEVSFASTSGFASNDTRASIAGISQRSAAGVATTGGYMGLAVFVPLEIPVAAGERIYGHTSVSGTPTSNALAVWLYIRQKGDPARSRRANFR